MLRINKLIWDNWNIKHIARHGVKPVEIEEACQSDYIVFDGKKGRLIVFGLTKASRVLAIVIDPGPKMAFTILSLPE